MLEKPIAVTYAQAMEIAREAKRSGRTLCVGMQKGYSKREQHIRQAVESGRIGKVKFVVCSENRNDWNARTWKYTDPASGKKTSWRNLKMTAGSSELEYSIHAFGLICSVIKSPMVSVAATGGVLYYTDGRDTRDMSAFVAEFENGVRLSYTFSCFSPASPNEFIVSGEKGVIRRDGNQITIAAERGKAEPLKGPAGDDDGAELQLYRDFFADVRARRPSRLSPEATMEPAKLAYATEISIAQKRIVTAKDFA
jgi:predicted dehydrogenase